MFREQGYGAVSMDQIARDAAVSKATVYAHFESKERLFAAIIENGCTAYAQGIVPEVKQLEDMREALTRISRSIESFLLAPKDARHLSRDHRRGSALPRAGAGFRAERPAALPEAPERVLRVREQARPAERPQYPPGRRISWSGWCGDRSTCGGS